MRVWSDKTMSKRSYLVLIEIVTSSRVSDELAQLIHFSVVAEFVKFVLLVHAGSLEATRNLSKKCKNNCKNIILLLKKKHASFYT